MRRLLVAGLCAAWIFAGAMRAQAQTAGAAASQPPQKPPTPALTGPLADDSTSLFSPRWNMFQLSGRLASIAGDQARWQRYEDLGDGLLFTTGRLLRERPEWAATLTADNLGWHDQRYSGSYERIGRFTVSGLWD